MMTAASNQTEFKKTIFYVTHSIGESIYLADRIVAMTYRPGKIKKDVCVDVASVTRMKSGIHGTPLNIETGAAS